MFAREIKYIQDQKAVINNSELITRIRNDIKQGDVLEAFSVELIKTEL